MSFRTKEFDNDDGITTRDTLTGSGDHVCHSCGVPAGEDEFDGNITLCDACHMWGCMDCHDNSIALPTGKMGTGCRGCAGTD